jgi:hypothetical protein
VYTVIVTMRVRLNSGVDWMLPGPAR